jgi:hypothetical protein
MIVEEIKNILLTLGIKNYEITRGLEVNVSGSVNLYSKELKEIPIKFGTITGNFRCDNNQLTSLKNCPKVVKGDFICAYNKLKSLEGCPEIIGGNFCCDNNILESLNHAPEIIYGGFYCNSNQLTSLNGCPKNVGGNFCCTDNKLFFPQAFYSLHYIVKVEGEFQYKDHNKTTEINGYISASKFK